MYVIKGEISFQNSGFNVAFRDYNYMVKKCAADIQMVKYIGPQI